MTMRVIFCLLYDLSKEFHIAFKVDIISTKNALFSRTSSWRHLSGQNVLKYTRCHNIIYDMTLSTESQRHHMIKGDNYLSNV